MNYIYTLAIGIWEDYNFVLIFMKDINKWIKLL